MSARLEEAIAEAVKGLRVRPSATSKEQARGKTATTRLRDRHHTLARMVAARMPDDRICFVMGMTQASLNLLKDQTPAFAELVWHYEQQQDRKVVVEEYLDQKARIARLIQLEIHDRLIEDPDNISFAELIRAGADYDDRTGYAKQTVNVNMTVDLAARLDHNRRQRALAGAGDGGGVSSDLASSRSAPPLLELQATPESATQGTSEPVAPSPPGTPPARKPVLHDMIMAGRVHRFIPELKEKLRRI